MIDSETYNDYEEIIMFLIKDKYSYFPIEEDENLFKGNNNISTIRDYSIDVCHIPQSDIYKFLDYWKSKDDFASFFYSKTIEIIKFAPEYVTEEKYYLWKQLYLQYIEFLEYKEYNSITWREIYCRIITNYGLEIFLSYTRNNKSINNDKTSDVIICPNKIKVNKQIWMDFVQNFLSTLEIHVLVDKWKNSHNKLWKTIKIKYHNIPKCDDDYRFQAWIENFYCFDYFELAIYKDKSLIDKINNYIDSHFTISEQMENDYKLWCKNSDIYNLYVSIYKELLICIYYDVKNNTTEYIKAFSDDDFYSNLSDADFYSALSDYSPPYNPDFIKSFFTYNLYKLTNETCYDINNIIKIINILKERNNISVVEINSYDFSQIKYYIKSLGYSHTYHEIDEHYFLNVEYDSSDLIFESEDSFAREFTLKIWWNLVDKRIYQESRQRLVFTYFTEKNEVPQYPINEYYKYWIEKNNAYWEKWIQDYYNDWLFKALENDIFIEWIKDGNIFTLLKWAKNNLKDWEEYYMNSEKKYICPFDEEMTNLFSNNNEAKDFAIWKHHVCYDKKYIKPKIYSVLRRYNKKENEMYNEFKMNNLFTLDDIFPF